MTTELLTVMHLYMLHLHFHHTLPFLGIGDIDSHLFFKLIISYPSLCIFAEALNHVNFVLHLFVHNFHLLNPFYISELYTSLRMK